MQAGVVPADLECFCNSRWQMRHCVVIIVELFVLELWRVTLGQFDVLRDLVRGLVVLLPQVRVSSLRRCISDNIVPHFIV